MPTTTSTASQNACGDWTTINGNNKITSANSSGLIDVNTTVSAVNPLIFSGTSLNYGYVTTGTVQALAGSYNGFNYTPPPKCGDIKFDSQTLQFKIYVSEKNEWVDCDVENISQKTEDNNKKTTIEAAFEVDVRYLKNLRNSRKVIFEKITKEKPITIYSGSTNLYHIWNPNNNGINTLPYGTGGNITVPYQNLGIGTITTIPNIGDIYYDTTNYTINSVTGTNNQYTILA